MFRLISTKAQIRAETLRNVMLEISGEDILEDSRKRSVVISRAMVSYELVLEGFAIKTIGKLIGRNHATVVYYRRLVEGYLSIPGYDLEKEIWEKFKERIS